MITILRALRIAGHLVLCQSNMINTVYSNNFRMYPPSVGVDLISLLVAPKDLIVYRGTGVVPGRGGSAGRILISCMTCR